MGMIKMRDFRANASDQISVPIAEISGDMAKLRTDLSRLDISGKIAFLDEEIELAGGTVPVENRSVVGGVITLSVDGVPMTIGIEYDMFRLFPQHTKFHTLEGADPEPFALALEHLLTEDLQTFEEHNNLDISILSVVPKTRFETEDALFVLGMTSSMHPEFNIYLWAEDNADLAAQFAKAFPSKEPRTLPQLKVPAAYVGPIACMGQLDIDAISEDDVLVLCQEWYNLEDSLNLLVRNEYLLPLHQVETGFAATDAGYSLSQIREKFQDGATMSPNDPKAPGSFSNPVTTVTVELMRTEMLVSELAGIQNGAVVDFDIQTIDTVHICADGERVAEGKLVKLDESFGIQVTKLL